jgi:hypothetical protein
MTQIRSDTHAGPPSFEDMVPERYRCLFTKPVIFDEDPRRYDALVYAIVSEKEPQSCFDWVLVREAVDKQWEIERLKKMKAYLIGQAKLDKAKSIVFNRTEDEAWLRYRFAEYREFFVEYNINPPVAVTGIRAAFEATGVDMHEIEAAAVVKALGSVMLLERAQASSEKRLMQLMNELFGRDRKKTIDHEPVRAKVPVIPGSVSSETAGETPVKGGQSASATPADAPTASGVSGRSARIRHRPSSPAPTT